MNRCDDYINHYRLDAEHFDYFNNPDSTDVAYERLFREFIMRFTGRKERVLDLGSGGGWTAMVPHECLYQIDLSLRNLISLKSETSAQTLSDAHFLPFKDESLDLIIASEILEHLNNPESASREIWRVLKPGGKAIISTPYKERLRYTLCIHCNQVTPLNAHLHSFDRDTLLSFFPYPNRRIYLFGSKVLANLRVAKLFGRLPLVLWRLIDLPLLKLIDRAQHIVVVLEK